MTTRARIVTSIVAAAGLLGGGCAYTTSTALLPSHIHTVAIPTFENATTEYTLEQTLTEAVVKRFVQDNHLKLVDEKSADAVIQGRITAYRNAVFGISDITHAQEYRVTITCAVVFKDQVRNRELWNEPNMVKTANYYVVDVPGQKAKTELDGRQEAIDKIADEILSRSVEGW
ncbi:MAG TPA: LptE family protein [Candidatus Eisenbacteria bacterium]|nr:LptE family protein [Candidatus Eisenbacteria bacterium]